MPRTTSAPRTGRRLSPAAAAHEAMMAAARDELGRFNATVSRLAWAQLPVMQTAFGAYRVMAVSDDHWYTTGRAEAAGMPGALDRRSFCGCNNGVWANLMAQAGVARHPRWA